MASRPVGSSDPCFGLCIVRPCAFRQNIKFAPVSHSPAVFIKAVRAFSLTSCQYVTCIAIYIELSDAQSHCLGGKSFESCTAFFFPKKKLQLLNCTRVLVDARLRWYCRVFNPERYSFDRPRSQTQ